MPPLFPESIKLHAKKSKGKLGILEEGET